MVEKKGEIAEKPPVPPVPPARPDVKGMTAPVFFEGDSPKSLFYKITARDKPVQARVAGRMFTFKKDETVVMSESCYRPLSKLHKILKIEKVAQK